MNRMNKLAAAVITAGLGLVPSLAHSQATTQFIGSGSSALWQTAGIASWELSGKLHHYTFKLTGAGVGVVDTRNTADIAPEQGSMWIVWDSSTAPTQIYVGVSLDSSVGDRLFLGTNTSGAPAGKLVLPSTIPAPANLITVTWGADDASLPAAVVADINKAPEVTASFTDIRPEDAAFATARAHATLGASVNDGAHNYAGLGYTGALSPTVSDTNYVESSFSTASFQVVPFNTHGTDPISGATIPPFTSYRVGISPIVLLVNRTDTSGLGASKSGKFDFTNLTSAQATSLWDGSVCNTSAFAVSGAPDVALTVAQREPLSGTYNTFEYQVPQVPYDATVSTQKSQEDGVNPTTATGNPLDQTCTSGGGVRRRAIGTGEMVNTAILNTKDSIGYAFFSFGNVSKIAGSTSYGYLTVNGFDPINASYTNGELPTTGTLSSLFKNVADGNYPIWSDLRIITNNVSENQTVASDIASRIQTDISNGTQLPDFIPFSAATIYRSHYSNGTYTNGSASNGLGGTTENGADVNGCIEKGTTGAGTLNCRL